MRVTWRRGAAAAVAAGAVLALMGSTPGALAAPSDISPDNSFSCYAPGGALGHGDLTHCGSVLVRAGQSIKVYVSDQGGGDDVEVAVNLGDQQVGDSGHVGTGSTDFLWTNNDTKGVFVGAYFAENGWGGGQTVKGRFIVG